MPMLGTPKKLKLSLFSSIQDGSQSRYLNMILSVKNALISVSNKESLVLILKTPYIYQLVLNINNIYVYMSFMKA